MRKLFKRSEIYYTPKEAENAEGWVSFGGCVLPIITLILVLGPGEQIIRSLEIQNEVGNIIQVLTIIGVPTLLNKILIPSRVAEIRSRTREEIIDL